jgi:hypothetical protein
VYLSELKQEDNYDAPEKKRQTSKSLTIKAPDREKAERQKWLQNYRENWGKWKSGTSQLQFPCKEGKNRIFKVGRDKGEDKAPTKKRYSRWIKQRKLQPPLPSLKAKKLLNGSNHSLLALC